MSRKRKIKPFFKAGEEIHVHFPCLIVSGKISRFLIVNRHIFYRLEGGQLIHQSAQPIERCSKPPSYEALLNTELATNHLVSILLNLQQNPLWRTFRQVADSWVKLRGFNRATPAEQRVVAKAVGELVKKGLVRIRFNPLNIVGRQTEVLIKEAGLAWLVINGFEGEMREEVAVI